MKKVLLSCLVVMGFLLTFCGSSSVSRQTEEPPVQQEPLADCKPDHKPFVLLEMFTYEGCHSCAEAELVFNSLIKSVEQNPQKPNVIAISEHIAYWNHLEWPDKYGLPIFDSIQTQYCKKLDAQTYTPQLVINGMLLGVPDPKFMQQNMLYFLNQPAQAALCIEQKSLHDTSLIVAYNAECKTEALLVCMLLESNISSHVTSGDNAGKTLHHENVARAYAATPLKDASGQISVEIPADVKLENAQVIAFLKDPITLKIIGATQGFKLTK